MFLVCLFQPFLQKLLSAPLAGSLKNDGGGLTLRLWRLSHASKTESRLQHMVEYKELVESFEQLWID
jgi:hypothetical protein